MATRETDRTRGTVEDVQEKGKELAGQAQEQVQQKAHELGSEAQVRLRDQVDQRSTQAGEQMQAVGDALRRGSEQLRTEGKDAPAVVVEQVARRASDLGGYLRRSDGDQILGDIERFARRRPWLTAAAGMAAGFLASRFVKASSARRYEEQRFDGRYALPSETSRVPAAGV
jgi:ElaB/YqjD/DUF883 family membrane-anchored ribosome-binding protein